MKVFIAAASRTVIAPQGGALKTLDLHELAGPALIRAWEALGLTKAGKPDTVILGNALGAGGNPARVAAIAAFGQGVPAMTIDTQCCSGMDAIGVAANRIRSGESSIVLAGGVESFSRAPVRMRKTDQGLVAYQQARFSPDPNQDPDVLLAAQQFAIEQKISRRAQEDFAMASHAKALAWRAQSSQSEMDHRYRSDRWQDGVVHTDPFNRLLTEQMCARMPPLIKSLNSSESDFAITAATVAPQADGAAVLALLGAPSLRLAQTATAEGAYAPIEVVGVEHAAGPTVHPALAGAAAAKRLIEKLSKRDRARIACVEMMESFAAQAIHNQRWLGFSDGQVNRRGGLLAAGHPIGASGAVLVGNLFYGLQGEPRGALGLAFIPAAGGLGSAILLRKP